ncbi:HlyD family efflux transporter periplasmic adaptor subunit [Leisingera daeponensis]|uniref:HlyD family efflux transporter periplasmic adaptor subunit n=1 Tax=Leisingera daeponensis TaxID=405746 RepID=A0ABS7NN08_9RHOB|nr:HlyD family secretion protein [Leisingera daeponensis]MBY6141546.1 HlyD family efflux transporter periplasmic adaptor subunit [Leisingera daeponensis]
MTSYISRAAVVNAPIISVKSPFDGALMSDALAPATPVLPATAIVELQASRSSRTELARLEARIGILSREETSISREIAALTRLDQQLLVRMGQVQTLARQVLEAQLSGLRGELAAARERQERLARDAERLGRLSDNGSVPQTQADTAVSLAAEANGEVIRLAAAVEETVRSMAGIKDGILPGLGTEDGSYARQRRDEVAIRLADLKGRKARAAAQRAGLLQEAEALRKEVDRFDRFAPQLPTGTVVWSATPAKGAVIASGDEVLQLLDCSRRFVEVFVHETAFEAIRPGDTARVRLRGSDQSFHATVEALRGAGSQRATGLLAAEPENLTEGSLSVMLRLAPADVAKAGVAQNFCDVGRTAEVRFDRGFGSMLTVAGLWFEELLRGIAPPLAGALSPEEGGPPDAG